MSWIKEPIKNLFNIEKGSLQSSKNVPGEYDFITAAADWKTNQAYDHECEALVFACAASGSLGRTHYVNGKFIASDLCFILTPKEGKKINMKFYHTYFNSIRKDIVKKTATGSAKLAINRKNFENYEIVYGDIDDQNKAQTLFGKYLPFQNELSVNVDESKELVNKLRQSILQDAIQGKLIQQYDNDEPASELLNRIKEEKITLIKEGKIKKEKTLEQTKDEEKPFDIPESWQWVRLKDIGETMLGKTLNKGTDFGEKVQYLCSINVYRAGIDRTTLKTALFSDSEKIKYSLRKGDLLVVEGGDVGRTAVWDSDDIMYYQNALHRIRFYGGISPYYFRYVMMYFKFIGTFDSKSKGVGIRHLVQGELCSLLFPLPPLEEQKRIVAKLDKLMKLCDELEEKINSTGEEGEKLVDSVLQNIFKNS